MKKFNKVLVIVFTLAFTFSLTESFDVYAATTPSLGAAATYGVLSDTYTNPLGPTTILGDVGFTTGPAVVPLGGHPSGTYPNYGSGAPYATAGADQATALTNLNSQGCTFSFSAGAIDLSATGEHSSTYTPGVYCIDGAVSVGTVITLDGAGTYIFRSNGALNTVAGSIVTLSGTPVASACDVFWTPNGAATLNANSTFIGTVIPISQDITVLSTTSWIGRALTFLHTVTTPNSNVSITVPACAPPILHLRKLITNDNGGTATTTDFVLTANGTGANDISGTSPVDSGPGLLADTFALSETSPSDYTASSWVCVGGIQVGSNITLLNNEEATCTITNNDNAPSLTLDKIVINDSGGVALESGWILTATGPTSLTGLGAAGAMDVTSDATFDAGTYVLSESTGPSGYTASDWSCIINGGAPIVGASVAIDLDDDATCTITNDDITATPSGGSSGGGSGYSIVVPPAEIASVPSMPLLPAKSNPTLISTPAFPKTGFPPKRKSTALPIFIFSSLSLFSIFLYFGQKKHTT